MTTKRPKFISTDVERLCDNRENSAYCQSALPRDDEALRLLRVTAHEYTLTLRTWSQRLSSKILRVRGKAQRRD